MYRPAGGLSNHIVEPPGMAVAKLKRGKSPVRTVKQRQPQPQQRQPQPQQQQQQPQQANSRLRHVQGSSAGVESNSSEMGVDAQNNALIKGQYKIMSASAKSTSRVLVLNSGVSSVQGRRPTMEDVHSVNLSIPWTPPGRSVGISYAAVYDGHCGRHVAELASSLLPSLILSQRCFPADPMQAITRAFVSADRNIYKKVKKKDGGSTCVSALLVGCELYVGNLGDSRAVLVETSGLGAALTQDHKPMLLKERVRIEQAGGCVAFGRVGGCLAVSRAFGDYEFKGGPKVLSDLNDLAVSNIPEVTKITLTDSCEALILACDGLWDVVGVQEAATTAHSLLHAQTNLQKAATRAAEALTHLALAKGSTDNITVVVITLHNTIV